MLLRPQKTAAHTRHFCVMCVLRREDTQAADLVDVLQLLTWQLCMCKVHNGAFRLYSTITSLDAEDTYM